MSSSSSNIIKRKWRKRSKYVKSGDNTPVDARPTDRVIALMGPTGVGKSTFINTLVDDEVMKVGHTLESCTAQVEHVIIPGGKGKERIIILDTPGFDDTYVDDAEILRRISVWLATSYVQDMKLAGIVYLSDITQTRMHGSVRENIEVMKELCGKEHLQSVICVTTKWSDDPSEIDREKQLKEQYFAELLNEGAGLERFHKTYESARRIVELILRNNANSTVRLQVELVDKSLYIPDTGAGRRLRTTLEEFLKRQRSRNSPQEKISKTEKAIKTLDKKSIMDKIKDFLKVW